MSCQKNNTSTTNPVVRASATLALTLCALLASSVALAVDSGDILVVSLKGEVFVTMSGAKRAVRAGSVLEPPATLRTGRDGAVELRQGATTLSVGPETAARISCAREARRTHRSHRAAARQRLLQHRQARRPQASHRNSLTWSESSRARSSTSPRRTRPRPSRSSRDCSKYTPRTNPESWICGPARLLHVSARTRESTSSRWMAPRRP